MVFGILRAYARARLGRQLRKRGLMYEDILIEEGPLSIAIARLPEHVRVMRQRRMMRAVDLSLKFKDLPKDLQNYDPFESYMGDLLQRVEAEELEKKIAGRK